MCAEGSMTQMPTLLGEGGGGGGGGGGGEIPKNYLFFNTNCESTCFLKCR